MRWVAMVVVVLGAMAVAVCATLYGVIPALVTTAGCALVGYGLFGVDIEGDG